MEPTKDELSIEIERRLHREVIKNLKIREDWCKSRNFATIAIDSPGRLKELQDNFLSAVKLQQSKLLVAVVLEALGGFDISPRTFSPNLEFLDQIDCQYGPFEWALTDSNLSFVILLTTGDYIAAAGPQRFLETFCGTTLVKAREEFRQIASDTSVAQRSMEELKRQGNEPFRAAMEAYVKQRVKRLLDVAEYYERISCE